MTAPQVTVVTPTRNRRRLLAETLDSVASQTLDAWEHIVVDDGSDDDVGEMMLQRAAADPRVRYIVREGERTGANVCRNLGAQHARADTLVFLDDDDRLHPGCLAARAELMRRNPDLDFAVFAAEIFDQRPGDLGQPYGTLDAGDDLLGFLSMDCPWQTTGPIWRRRFFEDIGRFDESLLSMQDLELHVRALVAPGRYVAVRRVDHYIRAEVDVSRTSTKHFKNPEYIQRSEAMPAMLRARLMAGRLASWSRLRALLGMSFGTAERWSRVGRLREAWASWARACAESRAPATLRIGGATMLALMRIDPDLEGPAFRIVNKWKGWVRFRQEPALIGPLALAERAAEARSAPESGTDSLARAH
jgi:glycosyltransferase involved in cell wall biosynthesis